ncbi:MAG: DNA cytosine methyltransferase [Candidatus Omnitrophica bacterium]|nr:DNA cytosine methyltransferase [Candidatus Omnitrophota bacterium]
MIFKLGELFSGPGGLALGAKQARVRKAGQTVRVEHVWANDLDPDSCKTYARNICPKKPESVICRPVETLILDDLDPIDALAFGFPCNDFSVVGEQKGFNGKYGPLYRYGVRILNLFKPKWFFAENVGGLQSANGGQAFRKILDDLKSAGNGYVLTPHLYQFEEYGVPQCRHRVVIIGIDKTLGRAFKVPSPTTKHNPKSARVAIESPPISKWAKNNELTKQSKKVIERLRYTPPGENAWSSAIPERLRLNVRAARMSQIYRRLHPDKPSYTITGSGGGGTHGYHWYKPRALTNRERARLQTFPDWFVFEGSKESVRKQIGMAVPPAGAKVIIEAILKTFAGVPYRSVEARWSLEKQQLEFFNEEALAKAA